jgi:DNA-binding beta-propeller fold protein YncE
MEEPYPAPVLPDVTERPARRAEIRARAARRRRLARLVAAGAGVGVVAVTVVVVVLGAGNEPAARKVSPAGSTAGTTTSGSATVASTSPAGTAKAPAPHLVVSALPSLPVAVQDAAAVPSPSGILLLGGLTASDTSTNRIVVAGAGGARLVGHLPASLHDAAAARVNDKVYFFGGGDGSAQRDAILRFDPATGVVKRVGRLPAASSDVSSAVIGGTAYLVGGFDGARWLNTVVAYTPGKAVRVVGHLPYGVRYAAVAAAGGLVVVAGGTLSSGAATSSVLAFDPVTGRARTIGHLPAPTTHGAAAALGAIVYAIGGRGSAVGSATARIVAIDPVAGTVRTVARLDQPRSDLAAVTKDNRILVAGGTGAGGTTRRVRSLHLVTPSAPGSTAVAPSVATVPGNVYAYDAANMLTGAARTARSLVYVPEGGSDDMVVINPRTYRIIARYRMGRLPQHITPSYDLKTLYLSNNVGNSLQAVDPRTGKPKGAPIPIDDPYNLYYTPTGRYAIVVAERNNELDFRDPHTWAMKKRLPVPCRGIDHMDFSADGTYMLASCEFSGDLVRVDLPSFRVRGPLRLGFGAMPQDVKLSPDGAVFYVADNTRGGIYVIDGRRMKIKGFIRTGAGAHGLYPSRDATKMYISNRIAGSISVLSFATRRVIATWHTGGSPDMGGVSADGKVLWLSSRYSGEVLAISTANGHVLARIPVGAGPHGLAVWPQPGRYSLGHTGILR